MSDAPQTQPPGWYYAQGDPPGTQRYWDGAKWEGAPQPVPGASAGAGAGGGAPAVAGLAEPVMRIAARLIDWVLWFIVALVVSLVIAGGSLINSDASFVASFFSGILITLLVAAYEIFMVGSRGQTVGKMLLNLRVVKADKSPVTMNDAALRVAPYIAVGLLVSVPIIGLLGLVIGPVLGIVSTVFLFTDPMRQAIWDKLPKTIVIADS